MSEGIYRHLLGTAWLSLDDAVCRLHSEGDTVRATGIFRVRRGNRRLARLVAWLVGLPPAANDVDVRLTITPCDGGEEWRRLFATHALVSRQRPHPSGLLAERVGMIELRFRLAVVDGALDYHTDSAAVCVGPLSLPLPRGLTPRVTAREAPAGGRAGAQVRVQVELPLLGLLVEYEGTMTRLEAEP